jgi:hypothetical protein
MAEVTCPVCGKVCKNQGGLNLHMRSHKRGNNIPEGKEEKVTGCEHEFRLLNPLHPTEQKAMSEGWKGVCVKCQELQ